MLHVEVARGFILLVLEAVRLLDDAVGVEATAAWRDQAAQLQGRDVALAMSSAGWLRGHVIVGAVGLGEVPPVNRSGRRRGGEY